MNKIHFFCCVCGEFDWDFKGVDWGENWLSDVYEGLERVSGPSKYGWLN